VNIPEIPEINCLYVTFVGKVHAQKSVNRSKIAVILLVVENRSFYYTVCIWHSCLG